MLKQIAFGYLLLVGISSSFDDTLCIMDAPTSKINPAPLATAPVNLLIRPFFWFFKFSSGFDFETPCNTFATDLTSDSVPLTIVPKEI